MCFKTRIEKNKYRKEVFTTAFVLLSSFVGILFCSMNTNSIFNSQEIRGIFSGLTIAYSILSSFSLKKLYDLTHRKICN